MRQFLYSTADDFARRFAALVDDKREAVSDVRSDVEKIIADVRARGDKAVIDYTRKFDKFDLKPGQPLDIDSYVRQVAPDLLAALDLAAQRIEAFHSLQKPQDFSASDNVGVRTGLRWGAIDAVGLYVPGGQAAYPSSVLMNALPAKVAGVGRVVMVVPTPDGIVNPLVIAAAQRAGISEIYQIGGAQAVAALAYGTETIAPVDKIVGPGNAYVAEAKRQVFGRVGIDMIAGPSEIVVIADKNNNPDWIAIDLLSQAEHDAAAQAILITDNKDFAQAVDEAVENWLKKLSRESIARASWDRYGAIIVTGSLAEAAALSNRLAPEHLELAVADPDGFAQQIRHAGSIFLGASTPEAIGDYIAGPNHVLPTGRSARFSSGLSVYDFMKRTTWASCTADSLRAIGPAAVTLANAEGLEAHALSISVRLTAETAGNA